MTLFFATVLGNRAKLSGLKSLRVKEKVNKKNEIAELKVFKYIFYENKNTLKLRINEVKNKKYKEKTIKVLLNFLSSKSERSLILP